MELLIVIAILAVLGASMSLSVKDSTSKAEVSRLIAEAKKAFTDSPDLGIKWGNDTTAKMRLY